MTLTLAILALVATLWLPDLVERLITERELGGFNDHTKAWKRWSDSMRMREGR